MQISISDLKMPEPGIFCIMAGGEGMVVGGGQGGGGALGKNSVGCLPPGAAVLPIILGFVYNLGGLWSV